MDLLMVKAGAIILVSQRYTERSVLIQLQNQK